MGSGAQVVVGTFYVREVFLQDVIRVRDYGLEVDIKSHGSGHKII